MTSPRNRQGAFLIDGAMDLLIPRRPAGTGARHHAPHGEIARAAVPGVDRRPNMRDVAACAFSY